MPIPVAAMTSTLSMSDNGFSDVAKIATGSVAALGAAVVAAGAAVAKLTADQFPVIDQTAKFSKEVNLATEALEGFRLAANISGIDSSNLDKAFQKMLKSIGEARQGLSTPIRGFKAMGIALNDLEKNTPEQVFLRIADAVQRMQDPFDRAAALTQIFGRSGSELAVLFQDGAQGIKGMQREAERLGITFSAFDAAKVEAANDSITKLKASFKGIFNELAFSVAPAVEGLVDLFTEWSVKFRTDVLPGLIDGAKNIAIEFIRTAVQFTPFLQLATEKMIELGRASIAVIDLWPMMSAGIKQAIENFETWLEITGQTGDLDRFHELQKEHTEFANTLIDNINRINTASGKLDLNGLFATEGVSKAIDEINQAPSLIDAQISALQLEAIVEAEEAVKKLKEAEEAAKVETDKKSKGAGDVLTVAVNESSQQALAITTRFLQGGGQDVQKEQLAEQKKTTEETKRVADGIGEIKDITEANNPALLESL